MEPEETKEENQEENTSEPAHLVCIDETWLPGISDYRVDLEDIDSEDTARSETGRMNRAVVRKKVKKLSLTLRVSQEQVTEITELIGGDTVTMTVYCPADPNAEDGYVDSKFYVSKISADMMTFREVSYWTLSFNAIEV